MPPSLRLLRLEEARLEEARLEEARLSPVGLLRPFPCCLRLASLRMSMISVANSRALKRANFWRPWGDKRAEKQRQSFHGGRAAVAAGRREQPVLQSSLQLLVGCCSHPITCQQAGSC